MKRYVKTFIIVLIILAVIAASLFGLYRSRTDVGINPSPTGEYTIKMYWTDVGGWGWMGKVYIVKHGFIDKKYWTGYYVPASCKWVSDYEFEIHKDRFYAEDLLEVHSVFEFIPE